MLHTDACGEKADNLSQLLVGLEPWEIISFDEHLNQQMRNRVF